MQVRSIRIRLRAVFLLLTILLLSAAAFAQANSTTQPKAAGQNARKLQALNRPLSFEANRGQTDGRVKYLSRGPGYSLFLTQDEAVLSLSKVREARQVGDKKRLGLERQGVVRLKLAGANRGANISGERQTPGKTRYYIGKDPSKWQTEICSFERVRYSSAYPGIDVVYYGNQRMLEHDFIVKPGADPRKIRLEVQGTDKLSVENGDLVMGVGDSSVRMLKPVVYQEIDGKRRNVKGRYVVAKRNQVGFAIGKYDRRYELVIDPVLSYSTFLGGKGDDFAYSIAINDTGNQTTVYVAGITASADFPGASGSFSGNFDVFVTRVDGYYTTYLGGTGEDVARSVSVDMEGTAYIGGYTASADFPATGNVLSQSRIGGAYDGFLAQLTPAGALVTSGYYGGSGDDQILGIRYDGSSGRLIATGYTQSADFPVSQQPDVSLLPAQLYTTSDSGANWTSFGANLPMMDIRAVLALGSTYYAGGSGGIFSYAVGSTWTKMFSSPNATVTCLVPDYNLSNALFACTDRGLYHWDGTMWKLETGLPATEITTIATSPASLTTVYAGTSTDGVFRSFDGGNTWAQINDGLPVTDIRSLLSAGVSVYAGIAASKGNTAFYRFDGSTWSEMVNDGLPLGVGVSGNSLSLDANTGRIYVGIEGYGAFVTPDGGDNWWQLSTELLTAGYSSYVNAFAIEGGNSNNIYVGTENGVWQSTDAGTTFHRVDSGFTATSVKALIITGTGGPGQTSLLVGANAQQGFTSFFQNFVSSKATLFGGDGVTTNGGTEGRAVTSDAQSNVYVTGKTPSLISLPNPLNPNNGDEDAFVIKYDSTQSAIWSEFIGGTGFDVGNAIFATAYVYVGGKTYSNDFPTTSGAYGTGCNNNCASSDGFFVKLDAADAVPLVSSTFGGVNADEIRAIAPDNSGDIYVAGFSNGNTLPVANPVAGFPGTNDNAFVSEFSPDGKSLLFSSLLGGTGQSVAHAMAIDSVYTIYLAGHTYAPDFPVSGEVQRTIGGGSDAFITQITSNGNTVDVAVSVTPTSVNVSSGTSVTFDITLTNKSGNITATNVAVSTNLSLDSMSSLESANCSTSTRTCIFASIPPGGTVTAAAQHTYAVPGNFADTFVVRADESDSDLTNNQQVIPATVTQGATDLGISMTGPSTVSPGQQFNYTVAVTNNGPASISNFPFTATFSDALQVALPNVAGCSLNGKVMTCTVASLDVNAFVNYSFTVLLPADTISNMITSMATVSVAGDPVSGNDLALSSSNVVPGSDLHVAAYGPEVPTVVGAPASIDVSVIASAYTDPATNVVLTFQTAGAFQYNSSSGLGTCSGTGTITCVVAAQILPGNMVRGTMTFTPLRPGQFTVKAVASSDTNDPNPGDNIGYGTVTAIPVSNGYESYVVSDLANGMVRAYSFGSMGNSFSAKAGDAPGSLALDVGGRYAFVSASGFAAYTSVVDFTTGNEVARIRGVMSRPAVITPDGTRYIGRSASHFEEALQIVDTSTFQIIKKVSLDGLFGDQPGVVDLTVLGGVVANNKLYLQLSTPVGSTTGVVNLSTYSVSQVTGASTGAGASTSQKGIAASGDGTRVYALRRGSPTSSILVINTSTDTVVDTISVPIANAQGIAVTPDPNDPQGQFAYVVGSGLIGAIDLNTRTQAGSNLSLGVPANLIVLSSDGNIAHVFRSGYSSSNNAAVLDVYSLRNGYMSPASAYSVGSSVGGVTAGFVISQPIPNSPAVTDAAPYFITDPSVATKVSVFGSNFANGAKVKIGNLDPLPSTFVSSGRLDVTLPAGIGEQDADVTVTLPNGQEIQTRRNVSGTQTEALRVQTSFQLHDPLLVLQHGNSSVSYISQAKNGSDVSVMTPNPLSMAVSPDGTKVFVAGLTQQQGPYSANDGLIEVRDIATGSLSGQVWVAGDLPGYQDGFAIAKDPLDGKNVLYFVSKDPSSQNERLSIIELDTGMYGLKRFYITNYGDYSAANTLVVSPDGQYVYVVTSAADPASGTSHGYRLVTFNTGTGQFSQLANLETTFGVEAFPNHMRISPDGKWLVLPASDGGLKIFDIGTNPGTPAIARSIAAAGQQYKTFQIAGSRLFAFDSMNNVVSVFDIANNWSKLGSITVPGVKGVYEAPMTVDPTGAYIYLALKDEDSLVALDANKVAASDPTAVLAQGVAGRGMESILIPTITSNTVDLVATLNANVISTSPGLNLYLYGNVQNQALVDAHNVVATITLPPNMTAQTASFYGSMGTYGACTINGAQVVCNVGTVPGTQGAFVYVTTSPVVATGSLLFSINASSDEPDADSSTNQQQYMINSVPPVDLKTTANFPSLPIQSGQPINYTFDVANIGTGTATSIYISVTSDLTNINVTAAGITCSSFGGNAFCPVNILAGGASVHFTVTGYAPSDSPTLSISNSAALSSAIAADIDPTNNTAETKLPVSSGNFRNPAFVLTNADYGQIQMLDPATSAQSPISVEAGVFPTDTVFMPNGRTAFVPNLDAFYVSVIDLGVRKEIYRIKGVGAGAAALTSDATQLVVSDRYTNDIVVIDTTTFQVVKRINVGFSAGSMIMVGSKAYIVRTTAAPVTIVDLNTSAVTTIAGTNIFAKYGTHRIMQAADAMVIALGGGTVAAPATLLRIDPGNLTLLQSLAIPTNTDRLTLAVTSLVSGPSYAYVTYDTQLSVVDTTPNSPTLMTFVPGLTATLDLTPAVSALSTDNAYLGLVARGSGVYPNYEMLMVGSLGSEPNIQPMGIPGNLISIRTADVDVLPDENAPIVTSVDPPTFLNSASQVITLTGTNFQPTTLVKVGKANPVAATYISSTQISVTVPQFTPSGDLDVVAINPNAGQDIMSVNVVGSYLDGTISIANGPGYDGQWDAYVANFGDQSVTTNKGATTEQDQIDIPNPWGVAVTADNVAFGISGTTPRADSSLDGVGAIQLPGNVAYGDALAAVPDAKTGLQVMLIPSLYPVDQTNNDWTLNVIDADPFSPTSGTILRRINVNTGGTNNVQNGFAASPDGKKAYLVYQNTSGVGVLAVFDLVAGSVVQKVTTSLIGSDNFIQAMQVSPDNKYLAIANPALKNIKVYDVTTSLSPTSVVGTITPSNPLNVPIPDCCNIRIVNGRMWVFDPGTRAVQAFNFSPAVSDFTALGYTIIPGGLDPTFQGGLSVSPDGKTLFVAEYADDALDVYDADAVANSAANPLLARIGTGVAPVSIGVSQIPTFSHTADLGVAVSHSPDPVAQGAELTYTVTVTNFGPYSSGQILLADDLPAGVTLNSSVLPPSVTCSGATSIRCQIGEMAANENLVLKFTTSTAGAPYGFSITNSVSVSMFQSSIVDPISLNNVASTTVEVALPNTTVAVTSDVSGPSPGAMVTYTATVTNNGNIEATSVSVQLHLDSGTWVSSPDCNPDGDEYCKAADPLAPGASVIFHATAQMPSLPGKVTVTANVWQSEADANNFDNVTSYAVTVTAGAAADLVLLPASTPVVINNKPTYTVTVKNNGPDTATNVIVTDELTRFGYDTSFASVGSCTYDGVKVMCSIGDLASSATAIVNVSVIPPESGWASNEFRANSSVSDPNPQNNAVNKAIETGIPGNTAAGLNVAVDTLDDSSGMGVNFLFGAVYKPGMTAVTSTAATQPPVGYRFGSPARIFDFTTTAVYAGAIRVTLSTAGMAFHHPDKVRLFHLENGVWVDRTFGVDTARKLVSALTSSLSPFILAEPLNSIPVANAGADRSANGTSANGTAVAISAAASTDADGDALTYRWTGPFAEGNGTVTGANPNVTLPLGTSKVTLVVNDGESDSAPATVNFTVTDFLIAAGNNSLVLPRGGTATFTVAVTPKYGAFDAPVALACVNLPSGVTCSFSSNTVTPGLNGDTVTVTLTATPNAASLHHDAMFAFWFAGVPVLGILLTGSLRRKKIALMAALLVLLAVVAVQVGCGGGSSVRSDSNSRPAAGTTTNITVTGISSALQRSNVTTVTLQ